MKIDFSAHEWLESWSTETLELFKSKLKPAKFLKNDWVHRMGDTANVLYFIEEGTVRISATDENGKELIVRDLLAGSWFGFIGCFGSGVRPNDAIAEEDTRLVMIHMSDLEVIGQADPMVWRGTTEILARYVEYYYQIYENSVFLPLADRLESTIKQLCEWQNSSSLTISQGELASILGATKEAVGVNLNKLQAKGIVELGYRNILYVA
jgi:CRP-like cAMP-binding protein